MKIVIRRCKLAYYFTDLICRLGLPPRLARVSFFCGKTVSNVSIHLPPMLRDTLIPSVRRRLFVLRTVRFCPGLRQIQ